MISSSQRALQDKTQHSPETDIHARGGIRTLNNRRRPRLKPRGNRDRLRSALRLSSATWCNRPYWARASSIVRLHDHTQRDAPHSAGLFWMNDPPSVETSTWQHTSLKRDKHSSPGGIRTRNPSKQAAADPSLRPRGVVIIIQLDLLFIYSNMYLFMRLLDSLVTNIPRKK